MKLVKVYNAKDDLEANIIADILKNSGIPCHIQDAGAGEYLSLYYGFTIFGKDIYVDERQLNDAKSLIDEINTSDADDYYDNTYVNSNHSYTDYEYDDNSETTSHTPWYYKKECLVRGMFLIPIVLAIVFTLLDIFGAW